MYGSRIVCFWSDCSAKIIYKRYVGPYILMVSIHRRKYHDYDKSHLSKSMKYNNLDEYSERQQYFETCMTMYSSYLQ